MKHPRGSLPWDIHKFVSDSPHGLDIFFRCNLPQFLADISDDTEYRTSHINRLLLPDCLVDLFFRIYSPWLTSKIRQGMKFVILCQRNFLPLIRCLVAERVTSSLSVAGFSVSNFARSCSVTFPVGSVVRRMISICSILHVPFPI